MSEPKRGRLVRDLSDGTVRQERGTVEENAVRIDPEAAAEMVEALNVVHAGTFNLFYLLRKHYWGAEGAESGDVAEFLQGAYQRLREIDDVLADRIAEIGGVPVNTPPDVQEYAPVHLEAEHLYTLRASLEGDLEAYAELAVSFREAIDTADELGDQTSRDLLADRLETLEDDAHTIERYVEDDTLVEVNA